jgi:hypothetical protein
MNGAGGEAVFIVQPAGHKTDVWTKAFRAPGPWQVSYSFTCTEQAPGPDVGAFRWCDLFRGDLRHGGTPTFESSSCRAARPSRAESRCVLRRDWTPESGGRITRQTAKIYPRAGRSAGGAEQHIGGIAHMEGTTPQATPAPPAGGVINPIYSAVSRLCPVKNAALPRGVGTGFVYTHDKILLPAWVA